MVGAKHSLFFLMVAAVALLCVARVGITQAIYEPPLAAAEQDVAKLVRTELARSRQFVTRVARSDSQFSSKIRSRASTRESLKLQPIKHAQLELLLESYFSGNIEMMNKQRVKQTLDH